MPSPDLAPITRHLRAVYGSRLLVAAVSQLNVFETLGETPLSLPEAAARLGLAERPARVLFPALCAMELLFFDENNRLTLTDLGRHLAQTHTPTLAGYVGLEGDDAGVLEMAERLRHDGPRDPTAGVDFVKDDASPSPMDDPETARRLTLGLAGRAQALAPLVAQHLPAGNGHLLDVAGGTGFFSYEYLLKNPRATATVFDRAAVLAVATELLDAFCQRPGAAGVRDRVTFQPGDMLTDPLPTTDVLLAASLFHDWPTDTCRALTHRFAAALQPGGTLWVHDAFLNDALDGPLAVTDYSAQLFWVTKGRAYSRAEYRGWFKEAGLAPSDETLPTSMDYGLIWATKP